MIQIIFNGWDLGCVYLFFKIKLKAIILNCQMFHFLTSEPFCYFFFLFASFKVPRQSLVAHSCNPSNLEVGESGVQSF